VPRIQVLRSANSYYKVVEKPSKYRLKASPRSQQHANKVSSRTVLMRDKIGMLAPQRQVHRTIASAATTSVPMQQQPGTVGYVTTQSLKPIRLMSDSNFVEYVLPNEQRPINSRPMQFFEVMNSSDKATETAKCLLLPHKEFSPTNLVRLTQTDFDVNAPVPQHLLSGQDILDALEE